MVNRMPEKNIPQNCQAATVAKGLRNDRDHVALTVINFCFCVWNACEMSQLVGW